MTTDRVHYNQPALVKSGHVSADALTGFIREALRDIRAYMHEHDLQPAGPPFAISTGTGEPGMVDVETGWPVEDETDGAGTIHSSTLPSTIARRSAGDRMIT